MLGLSWDSAVGRQLTVLPTGAMLTCPARWCLAGLLVPRSLLPGAWLACHTQWCSAGLPCLLVPD